MFCSSCGKKIDDGSRFCPFCGTRFEEAQVQQAAMPYPGMPLDANRSVQQGSPVPPQGVPMPPQSSPVPPQGVPMPPQRGSVPPQGIPVQPQSSPLPHHGVPVPPQGVPVPPHGVPVPPQGRPVPPSQFNPYAGSQQTSTNSPKKSKGPMIAIIAAAIVGMIVVFGVIGLVVSNLGDKKKISEPGDTAATDTSSAETTSKEEPAEDIGESDDTALNAVFASITEAETLKAGFYTTYESADQSTEAGMISIIEELDKLNTELARIKSEADAVEGLDKKAKKVETEYFNIMCNSHQSFYEIYNFEYDYILFFNEHIATRPEQKNNETYEDYYYRLEDWYTATIKAYDAVNHPDCVERRWQKLGDVLALNESVLDKLATAVNNEDWLRVFSAEFMAMRYEASEQVWRDMSYDICEGEGTLAYMQSEAATSLAAEFGDYIAMSQADREDYEFKNICDGEVYLFYNSLDTIYPSLFNTYDSFLIIESGCINGKRDVVVEAQIEGFTQKYQESFTLDSTYKVLEIKPPALTGNINLNTARDAQMVVSISDKNGQLIDKKSFPVHLTTQNDVEWFNDEFGVCTRDNILCFLTPESTAISDFKRKSIDVLSDLTGGTLSGIVGYQYDDILATYLQAAALQMTLSEMGVRYNMDSFSSDGAHQHVLLPNQVLEQKSGLCIETSLVMASALQSAGFHVFIVMPPGHAQVAVEVNEDNGSYFLIETTKLPNTWADYDAYYSLLEQGKYNNDSYWAPIIYMSSEEWGQMVSETGTYLIDCNDGPILGMTPFVN